MRLLIFSVQFPLCVCEHMCPSHCYRYLFRFLSRRSSISHRFYFCEWLFMPLRHRNFNAKSTRMKCASRYLCNVCNLYAPLYVGQKSNATMCVCEFMRWANGFIALKHKIFTYVFVHLWISGYSYTHPIPIFGGKILCHAILATKRFVPLANISAWFINYGTLHAYVPYLPSASLTRKAWHTRIFPQAHISRPTKTSWLRFTVHSFLVAINRWQICKLWYL